MVDLPKRKNVRLKEFDYSGSGCYFVTICTYNKQKLFGKIVNNEMYVSEIGEIVKFTWEDLVNHNNIKLHDYVIMPDHFHGIIEICDGGIHRRERSETVPLLLDKKMQEYPLGLPEIVRQFKSFSSRRINENLKRNGLEPFPTGKLWQKSYYEHIIRDEEDYKIKIRYIHNNILKADN